MKKKDDLYPGKNRMSLETAERMISQLMGPGNPVTFSWQGGEPTLMGLDFFKDVISLQKKHGIGRQRVSNTIQTNGILIDKKWAEFFSRYNFLVGLSLDGPKDLHNAYRRHPDGSGTWEEVMRAGNILKDYGVQLNILSVLNDKTVKKPKRTLEFFLDNGFTHLQFIPGMKTVEEGRKIAPFAPEPLEFGKFLDAVFEEWVKRFPPRFSVRYFNALIALELGKNPGFCPIQDHCGDYLVVENNGDVYPCDFFVELDKRLGNINEEPIEEIVKKEEFRSFASKDDLPKACKECEFYKLCHGGCQRYRGYPDGPKKRTYLCEGYKYFLSRNKKKIEEIANKF